MEDSSQLRDILDKAAELPPNQRPAYLDHACGTDSELRAEVNQLLNELDQNKEFLDSPTLTRDASAKNDPSDPIGSNIGQYKLLQRLGEGGMGVVYLAEQKLPVRRRVA